MDFDDLFENKNKNHTRYKDHGYDDDKYSQDSRHSYHDSEHQKWLNIWKKIRRNNKLKLLIILAILLVVGLIIGLIIILWPVVIDLLNYVIQDGLKAGSE